MVKKILDTILFCNFCFAYTCSRGRKKYLRRSLPYLIGHELLHFLCSIAIVIITRFEYRLPEFVLLIILLVLGYLSFPGTEKWVFRAYDKKELARRHDKLKPNTGIYSFVGFLLYAGSLAQFFIVAVTFFTGYSLQRW